MALVRGTRLGAYEILSPLGTGGMGEVYRAKDLRLGREIAIKLLPMEVASSADRLTRLEREARTVAALNHPNIVVLHTVEDVEGVRFLTMELIEGQVLSTLVAAGGLPLPKLLDLAIPLTDAIVAAHEKGVIHRDLKPGNVMVTREGRVKVLDFGLAKMLGAGAPSPQDTSATVTVDGPDSDQGHVVGTVPYMAPEQVRGETVDARSDLFSLGIILYELATGRRPFIGCSSAEVASAILRDTPEPLNRARGGLPDDLERLIGQCLEKNPRERVQTALDVNNGLRRLRKLLESGESAKSVPEKVASIAVLPFVNRSASTDDEYFSDGLADELLGALSKIRGLRVSARTSSFQFKGSKEDVPTIGRKLDVATLLEGSVRKVGNRIRVLVQLVRVADSSHLWSETYDRTLEDVFALQDEIAHSVVKELRATLLGEAADSDASGAARAEIALAAKGRGSDPEAHRLYLQARYLLNRWTREDAGKAVSYMKEALARDPNNALAWAELASAYIAEAGYGWAPRKEGYERAREAAARALALDPDLPEGHARIGWIHAMHDGDFRGAEEAYARALKLSPGNAEALRRAGTLAAIQGHFEEAIGLTRRAMEQDPLSAACHHNLGVMLHAAGRYAEAEVAFRKALELAPQRGVTRASRSLNLFALGRGLEALEEVAREPEDEYRLYAQAILQHELGRHEDSDTTLKQLMEVHSAYRVAEVYAARRDLDRAFEWLERAHAEGVLSEAKGSPHLRSLHGDPRWAALLKKLGLDG